MVLTFLQNASEITDVFNAFTIDLEVETTELQLPPGNGNEELVNLGDFPIAFITGTSQLPVMSVA